jgi:hypothetical protein
MKKKLPVDKMQAKGKDFRDLPCRDRESRLRVAK